MSLGKAGGPKPFMVVGKSVYLARHYIDASHIAVGKSATGSDDSISPEQREFLKGVTFSPVNR
jgi:hypothetical protein